MDGIRYFKNDRSFWRFAPGEHPQIRSAESTVWRNSIFVSLEQFFSSPEPDEVRETTAEDAESLPVEKADSGEDLWWQSPGRGVSGARRY